MMTFSATGGGGSAVVNENTKLADMFSGGSLASTSEIGLAGTVTTQVVLKGRFTSGLRVKLLLGEALCVNVIGVPVGHSTTNALEVALTLSLKFMVMFVSKATLTAPVAGIVLSTVGAASPAPKFCPVLIAPKLPVAGALQGKSSYTWPAPLSRSDCPSASLPSSLTPMSVLVIPFAGPPTAVNDPS